MLHISVSWGSKTGNKVNEAGNSPVQFLCYHIAFWQDLDLL